MDSLDALQVSLALQQHYGVRIEGAKDGRQDPGQHRRHRRLYLGNEVTPVYLQRGALRSALGADLSDAASNLLADRRPQPTPFQLHELQQPRPYFAVATDEALDARLDRLLGETLVIRRLAATAC